MKELRKSNNLYEVLKVQNLYGLVAQLVRAPPCHGGGRGFESHPGRLSIWIIFILWDLSSAGRASALQAEGHRFEPCRSHFFVIRTSSVVSEFSSLILLLRMFFLF